MELWSDFQQAYSWKSISHPFSSNQEDLDFTLKEMGICGGVAILAGALTFPIFPFTAFAAYYLSKHYILKNKTIVPIKIADEHVDDDIRRTEEVARASLRGETASDASEEEESSSESEPIEHSSKLQVAIRSSKKKNKRKNYIHILPNEIFSLIFSHLDSKDFFAVRRVSRLWNELSFSFFRPVNLPAIADNLVSSVNEPHYEMTIRADSLLNSVDCCSYKIFESKLFIARLEKSKDDPTKCLVHISVQDLITHKELEQYSFEEEYYSQNSYMNVKLSVSESVIAIERTFKSLLAISRVDGSVFRSDLDHHDSAFLLASEQYVLLVDLGKDTVRRFDPYDNWNEVPVNLKELKKLSISSKKNRCPITTWKAHTIASYLVFDSTMHGTIVFDTETGKVNEYLKQEVIAVKKKDDDPYLLLYPLIKHEVKIKEKRQLGGIILREEKSSIVPESNKKFDQIKLINLNTNEEFTEKVRRGPMSAGSVSWHQNLPVIMERKKDHFRLYTWDWQSKSKNLLAKFKNQSLDSRTYGFWLIEGTLTLVSFAGEGFVFEVYRKNKEQNFKKEGVISSHEEKDSPFLFAGPTILYHEGIFVGLRQKLEDNGAKYQLVSLDFQNPQLPRISE